LYDAISLGANALDGLAEALLRLRVAAVVVTDVEVDDGGAGLAAARCLVGDLLRGDR